jgi:3-hydroxy-9,10-secoandrosta-1,3,5(10)-triene-9,17-dione monooxygenase reductase component
MSMESTRFRKVMGHFATGVTLVMGLDEDGAPVGLTANAVTSVSLDPPLILVCLDLESKSRPVLTRTGRFGVSILRTGQEELALRFARSEPGRRFEGLQLRTEVTGAPILEEALGWADCRLWKEVEAGDHVILLGEVLACGVEAGGAPLVFFQGGFGTVSS